MHLASHIAALGTESAFEILARAAALSSRGRSVINLGIGQLVRNVQALAEEHAYRSVFAVDGAHPYLHETRRSPTTCPAPRSSTWAASSSRRSPTFTTALRRLPVRAPHHRYRVQALGRAGCRPRGHGHRRGERGATSRRPAHLRRHAGVETGGPPGRARRLALHDVSLTPRWMTRSATGWSTTRTWSRLRGRRSGRRKGWARRQRKRKADHPGVPALRESAPIPEREPVAALRSRPGAGGTGGRVKRNTHLGRERGNARASLRRANIDGARGSIDGLRERRGDVAGRPARGALRPGLGEAEIA